MNPHLKTFLVTVAAALAAVALINRVSAVKKIVGN